jgi:parallel beta-helix repeat protein
MPRVKKLAGLTFVTVLVVTLIVGVTPLVLADHNGDKGSFDILVFENGNWQLQGELSFSDYETLKLPLGNDAGQPSIRLVQHGYDAAYVDYVALERDSVTYLPTAAVNINSNTNVLNKVVAPEYDVCDAWDSTLEIAWDDVPANATLVMRAMQEDLGVAHGGPLYYPDIHRGETLSYTLVNDGGITVDGILEETTEPEFSVFWQPDSPHPDGYTYGWLHCDQDYLYAAVEVTADNTPDEEDWGALYVMVNGESKEFRISCDDSQWGANGFQYTSSVIYEHRIYEFQIPLGEINAHIGDRIDYGFGCYGTVAVHPYDVWVDDDWAGLNYSDPANGHTFGVDAFAVIQDGIGAVAINGTVHVRPGKYDGNLVIGDKSLTLQSTDGWQDTTIDPVGNIVWIWGDADVTVQGFEITGGYRGVYITDVDSEVNILDCFIHDNIADGIGVVGRGDLLHIEGNIITQNGYTGGGCGINMTQAWNTTNIFDNIIGAWTYYPQDYGDTGDPQRYQGNSGEGVYIDQVGNTTAVNIEGNAISENAWLEENTGIFIKDIYGVVTIAENDIGAWEDSHGGNYTGNEGQGVFIYWVYPGAVLTIGPDNRIKDNTDDGIEIFNVQPAGAASVTVHHNSIDDNWSDGIELGTPCEVDGATISYNNITNHEKGIFLTGPSDHNIIIHNTIALNGIGIYLQWVEPEYSSNNNTISDNEISNNGHGIWVEGNYNQILRNNILNNMGIGSGIHLTATALGNIIHCNNIESNVPHGVYNGNADEMVDATRNWWGDASGPSGAGPGTGDPVSDNVDYGSWLPAQFQYCPECVGMAPVGGEAYPVSKLGILAPLIVFGATIIAGLAILARRRRAGS